MKKIMKIILMLVCIFNTIGTNKNNSKDNNIAPQFSVNKIQEQHDGLYDPYIKSIYDSTRNVRGVALKDYYAPIYFRNLKNNIGNNLFGTCTFVAIGMLLSFWDTYWNDNIIPEQYESTSLWFNGTLGPDTDSPGIIKETGPVFEFNDLNTLEEKLARFKRLANNSYYTDRYFQIKLIKEWNDFEAVYHPTNPYDMPQTSMDSLPMTHNNIRNFLQYWCNTYIGYNTFNIDDWNLMNNIGGSDATREFIIDYVRQGIPVMVGISANGTLDTGTHTAIAYDYDETRDELYLNMGWGNNASHVVIDTYGYNTYNNAIALDFFNTPHVHSDGYRQLWSNDSYCACDYIKPFDLQFNTTSTKLSWRSLNNERWHEHSNVVNNDEFDVCITYDDFFYILPHTVTSNKYVYLNAHQSSMEALADHFKITIKVIHNLCNRDYDKYTCTKDVYQSFNEGEVHHIEQPNNNSPTTLAFSMDNNYYSTINFSFVKPVLKMNINYPDNLSISIKEDNDNNSSWITLNTNNSDSSIYTLIQTDNTYSVEFFKPIKDIRFASHPSTIYISDMQLWHSLPTSGYELPYEPELWNYNMIRIRTNCYGYAINNQLNPYNGHLYEVLQYQQPGEYYNEFVSNKLPINPKNYSFLEVVINNTIKDFQMYSQNTNEQYIFQPIGRFDTCPQGTYKVAFVYYITENSNTGEIFTDYHWYRQNPDGTWSHKIGWGIAKNVDETNKDIIYDPQVCERGVYNSFYGYFAITPWNNMYNPSVY